MYHHVIVPFDGTLEARAALAPAADLAWRCGAKVVIVTTIAIDDEVAHFVLKSQAIAKSGADVDFWVDCARRARRCRAGGDPVPVRAHHLHGLPLPRPAGCCGRSRRRRPLPEAVLRHSSVPVLIIGPETDLSSGLPLAELVMPIDDSAESGARRSPGGGGGGLDAAGCPVPRRWSRPASDRRRPGPRARHPRRDPGPDPRRADRGHRDRAPAAALVAIAAEDRTP